MPDAFRVEVLTPEGEVFNDDVEMVSTRTSVGSIGILARHQPLLGMLDPTELRLYKTYGDESSATRSLLITSAFPREGKSFISANTAQILARQPDKRVLLIDADLRWPRLHLFLGTPALPGLAEYLSGEAKELSVIQRGPLEIAQGWILHHLQRRHFHRLCQRGIDQRIPSPLRALDYALHFSRTAAEEPIDDRQYQTQCNNNRDEKWKMAHGMTSALLPFLSS